MYVIYPADAIISGLIAREYSPVEEQQRLRHQQRQQIIVPNLTPEDEPDFLYSPTSTASQLSPPQQPQQPPTRTTPSVKPRPGSLHTETVEIEKPRSEPVRPPRAASRSKSKHTSAQVEEEPPPPPETGELLLLPQPKRNKPKRSVSFTAAFRSRSKEKENTKASSSSHAGSSSSLAKVAPAPQPLTPKPGFFGSGSWKIAGKEKEQRPGLQLQADGNSLLKRRGLVPPITIAHHLEKEDHTFAHYRGQNYGSPPTAPVTLTSKKPPLPTNARALTNNTNSGTLASSHANPVSGSLISLTGSSTVRGGSVPRSLLLSSPSNKSSLGLPGVRAPSSSREPHHPPPEGRSSPSPFGRESSSPSAGEKCNSGRMAGIGLNGGSISGSLLTLGVGGHAAAHAYHGSTLIDANSLKDCAHPSLNESLKGHNALSFQVIRIVSDFTQQLSQLHEQHSVQLQMLVETFRKRSSELRKEKPPGSSALFQIWETLLQEVEIDSQAHSDISGSLGRQIARPLLEKTFCLKIQSRKVFAHRESFETVLSKAEALLASAYSNYSDACLQHIQQGNNATLTNYYDAHNAYVQQLRGTNAMLREYHNETLPALLQELEEVYVDLCNTLSESILLGSEIVSTRALETNRRYETLAAVCRNVNGSQDLKEYVKGIPVPAAPPPAKYHYQVPLPILQSSESGDPHQDLSHVPILKEEAIMERQAAVSSRNRLEALKKEIATTENEMKQLQDSMDSMIRMQERTLESNLWAKANELQEEISMKRYDLRVAQLHYAALKSQKELYSPSSSSARPEPSSSSKPTSSFANRINAAAEAAGAAGDDPGGNGAARGDRKGGSSQTGMKSKWLKAFKSLKSTTEKEADKKNGKEKDIKEPFQIFENHIFTEYTYKKITPCDICSQILRGHTRQGLRCRMCKMNVHLDCQEKVGKCQPKTRLLRRQRSTSELETRLTQLSEQQQQGDEDQDAGTNELDSTYQVLKEANVLKRPGGGGSSGSGSGSGFHGSNQTLHSAHERSVGRSNPSVNVISGGSSAHSGPSTPIHPSVAAASASGGTRPSLSLSQRRDSYLSRKSISADQEGSSGQSSVHLPPRSVSLTASPMPHSPRRRKLDLRMKSFSLDSPESTEHAQRRRYAHGSHSTSHSQSWNKMGGVTRPVHSNGGSGNAQIGNGMVHSNSASNNHAEPYAHPLPSLNHFAPSSPVHNRRALLSARTMRMSSVELPDENDKSLSSAGSAASPSPCPSPQKPQRLLPTNLYVCLYMFKARHPDELDLKAGNRVTVVDTTDPDWWQGKCMGKIGYFPSKYVTKLHPGEKPLQVTHNLQVTDGADNGLKLLRDQIVVQIGEELDGMVTIRNGDNKQGICPVKYLQEV